MNFTNLFSVYRSIGLHKREMRMRTSYNRLLLHIAHSILADADKGYVRFAIQDGARQIHCDLQWFSSVTDGINPYYIITFRHCLLAAINIILGANGEKEMTIDEPLYVFIIHDGTPVLQYTFTGESHVEAFEIKN